MAGRAWEAFPRQVLLGNPAATVSYYSGILDVREWRSITWWFEVTAALPQVVSNPARLYLETCDDEGFESAVDLLPDGEAPNVGDIATGVVVNTGAFLRARVEVSEGESAVVAVRLLVRST